MKTRYGHVHESPNGDADPASMSWPSARFAGSCYARVRFCSATIWMTFWGDSILILEPMKAIYSITKRA